jgi:hypothetical protein
VDQLGFSWGGMPRPHNSQAGMKKLVPLKSTDQNFKIHQIWCNIKQNPLYHIIFYTTERDDSPIDEFLDELDKKSRAKVEAYLSSLAEHGPHLKRP